MAKEKLRFKELSYPDKVRYALISGITITSALAIPLCYVARAFDPENSIIYSASAFAAATCMFFGSLNYQNERRCLLENQKRRESQSKLEGPMVCNLSEETNRWNTAALALKD